MAIFLDISGVNGDVTAQGYENQIELLDLQWSMSRTVRSAVGIGTQRESTSAYVSEVSITKFIDSASHLIAQKAFAGEAYPKATLNFTRTDQSQEATFRTIQLTDPIISGLSNSASSSGRPTEVVTLNFTQIMISDIASSATDGKGNNASVTYDLTKAKTV